MILLFTVKQGFIVRFSRFDVYQLKTDHIRAKYIFKDVLFLQVVLLSMTVEF